LIRPTRAGCPIRGALIAVALGVAIGCDRGPGESPGEPTSGTPATATTTIDVPPFRVHGAPGIAAEQARAIEATAALLRADLFEHDPRPTLDVRLVDPPAESRYSIAEHAIVVDRSQAAVSHFVVHAYVQANLPGCPVWVDEGLAALLEDGVECDGRLHGPLDDRLPALQDDIRAGALPTLEALTSLDHAGFHGERWDVNERMARYLCYHLQQTDRLQPFVRALQEVGGEDPTGCAPLRQVIGQDDLVAFQRDWEAWVLGLEQGEVVR